MKPRISIHLTAAIALLLAALTPTLHAETTLATVAASGPLTQQRNDFLRAERALKKNKTSQYKKLLPQLKGYPLTPYLEYKELSKRLHTLPYADIDTFLGAHANSYLGDRLLKSWLFSLAKHKRWHEYQSYYQHHVNNIQLQCYYLRARLNNGEAEAMDEIAPIWNVGKSRPKTCDPLFKQWIAAGRLTDDIVWDRHRKALTAKEFSLARHVSKFFTSKELANYAEQYRSVYSQPTRIFKTERYSQQTPETKEIILFGLKKAARKQPERTVSAWEKYDAQQLFSDSDRLDIQEHLAIRMAKNGNMSQAEALLKGSSASDKGLIERLIRASLKEQDWHKTLYWISKLPSEERSSERWRYWSARGLSATSSSPEQVKGTYASLALARSFYGFLAADKLGYEYKLVDRPVTPPTEMIATLRQTPGMLRAREFLSLNRINSARREWLYTTRDYGNAEMKAAGVVAQQWGWHRKGIQAMASARYWDDLQVRFPLAFQDQVETTSKDIQIERHLLFAVARQESAFTPDARSRVGATGLMQLMPGTAKETAKKIGIPYRKKDLLKPSTNIKLGGSYLNQLLDRFEGNRILAAAAYNAGPYRVSKWLNDDAERLPYDIWIETIPYKETRRYVQNILAYSVIYGYRLNDEVPFIRENEAGQLL